MNPFWISSWNYCPFQLDLSSKKQVNLSVTIPYRKIDLKKNPAKPNLTTLPQKAMNMSKDLALLGNYWGIPFKPPKVNYKILTKNSPLSVNRISMSPLSERPLSTLSVF
jgi:hypothetical protein